MRLLSSVSSMVEAVRTELIISCIKLLHLFPQSCFGAFLFFLFLLFQLCPYKQCCHAAFECRSSLSHSPISSARCAPFTLTADNKAVAALYTRHPTNLSWMKIHAFLLPNSLLSMCPLMVLVVATAAPAVSHTCSSGPKLRFSNEATTLASTVPAVGNMANFTLDVPLMLLWVVTRHSRLHCCRWHYLYERRWTWVPLLFFEEGGAEVSVGGAKQLKSNGR